ncbi:MAG: AmmeMemoRadiSam system protein B, partial [Thermoplasmataceae archaeon]
RLIGVVVPHAGYIYSGQTAAFAYSLVKNSTARDFAIIGPNHSSYPPETSIYPGGAWITPLGRSSVNMKMAEEIKDGARGSKLDEKAHRKEHSVEVQLPFLQYLFDEEFTFVPIIMGDQRLEMATYLSDGLTTLRKLPMIIASSDLTHYEPLETARRKDRMLLDAVESLDLHRFYRTLEQNVITACGYGAIATLMSVTVKLGGKMQVLNYSTSYETSGESYSVVGYSAIAAYLE